MPQVIQMTQKVYVQHVSLTAMMDAGWELDDGGEEERQMYGGSLQKEAVLRLLTRRQREVIYHLNDLGLSRKEAAQRLGVCLQAVHEIVLRMRKRLAKKGALWKT